MLTVQVAYSDGTVRPVDESFTDLRDAALFAVQLADDLGRTATPYSRGAGTARSVTIRRGDLIEFEIQVFAGGLSPRAPFAGLIDLLPDSGDHGE